MKRVVSFSSWNSSSIMQCWVLPKKEVPFLSVFSIAWMKSAGQMTRCWPKLVDMKCNWINWVKEQLKDKLVIWTTWGLILNLFSRYLSSSLSIQFNGIHGFLAWQRCGPVWFDVILHHSKWVAKVRQELCFPSVFLDLLKNPGSPENGNGTLILCVSEVIEHPIILGYDWMPRNHQSWWTPTWMCSPSQHWYQEWVTTRTSFPCV